MPLYDFRCDDGHRTERIVSLSQRETTCGLCQRPAQRQFSSRVAIVGPTTDVRGMYRRYAEASAEMAHAAETYERNRGVPAPTLPIWSAAKERAQGMVRAGEAPPKEI